MAVNLTKGEAISLTKEAPGLSKVVVGLGWDTVADLDASLFLLGAGDKVRSDSDFIFYNNKATLDESVIHSGDNRTGAGDGDDEQIKVNLDAVAADVQKLAISVSIHEAAKNNQTFGNVEGAFIRLVNEANGEEVVRYDLGAEFGDQTTIVFGELVREEGGWQFKAVGRGVAGGLAEAAKSYGVSV